MDGIKSNIERYVHVYTCVFVYMFMCMLMYVLESKDTINYCFSDTFCCFETGLSLARSLESRHTDRPVSRRDLLISAPPGAAGIA